MPIHTPCTMKKNPVPTTSLGHQQKFFAEITKRTISNQLLAIEISDLLKCSSESAYRRIRCETDLSLDEALILSRHYHVFLDGLGNTYANTVMLNYKPMTPENFDFKGYLEWTVKDLELISSLPDAEIIYTAKDIPIFHWLRYPLLSAFKIWFWMRSVFAVKSWRETKFDASLIDPGTINIGKRAADLYANIKSTEIWNEGTAYTIFKQIEHYWESGLFADKKVVEQLIDELEKFFADLKTATDTGKKLGATAADNFKLYYNEVLLMNNTILVHSEKFKAVYQTFNSIEFLSTTDRVFYDHVNEWVQWQYDRSALISRQGEKERLKFFRVQEERIDKLKKMISR